jgi:hypothetical protein
MTLHSLKQDLFYLVVATIIVALVYSALPNRLIQPHGILMPSQISTTLAPSTQNIPILNEYPPHYEAVGNIIVTMSLKNNSDSTLNTNMEACKNKAKALAEEAGAQAVVILRAGHYNKSMGLNSTILYAQAIKL